MKTRSIHTHILYIICTHTYGASLVAQTVKNLPTVQETKLGKEDPLEKGMANYSSILAWRATVHRVTKSWT